MGCPELLLAASLIYVRRVSGFVDFKGELGSSSDGSQQAGGGSVLAFHGPGQLHFGPNHGPGLGHHGLIATGLQQLSMLQYRDLDFEFFADDEACVA